MARYLDKCISKEIQKKISVVAKFLSSIFTLGLYIFDTGSDILVGVAYLREGETWWGSVTLTFAGLAFILTNITAIGIVYFADINDLWKLIFIPFAVLQLGMLFM